MNENMDGEFAVEVQPKLDALLCDLRAIHNQADAMNEQLTGKADAIFGMSVSTSGEGNVKPPSDGMLDELKIAVNNISGKLDALGEQVQRFQRL